MEMMRKKRKMRKIQKKRATIYDCDDEGRADDGEREERVDAASEWKLAVRVEPEIERRGRRETKTLSAEPKQKKPSRKAVKRLEMMTGKASMKKS